VFALADGIIPLPGGQGVIRWSIRRQHLSVGGGIALAPGEYAELVRRHSLVLVHARFKVPAFEFTAIRPGKSPGAKATDRRSLPITVVNHVLDFRFLPAGVFERKAEGATPRGLGNHVASESQSDQGQN